MLAEVWATSLVRNTGYLASQTNYIVQYAKAQGALVIAIDSGTEKRGFILRFGVQEFIDFALTDPAKRVQKITGHGAHAVVVTTGNAKAFARACHMVRVGGTLSCVGIPYGGPFLETPVNTIIIKGLKVTGNLVVSMRECMEAVDLVRYGLVKPAISIRPFRELPQVFEEMEKGDINGRVVLQVSEE